MITKERTQKGKDVWETEGIVKRYIKNPIILPRDENMWESELVYNTAAFKLDGTIYLIYRAMGEDHISRFGLAFSENGVNFRRFSYPVLLPTMDYEKPHSDMRGRRRERGGVEDPRAMVIGDYIYLIYTAFHKMCHLAMARMKLDTFKNMVKQSIERSDDNLSLVWNDSWERIGLIFPDLFEVPELFSRNSVMMRLNEELFLLLYRIHKGDILVSFSNCPEGPWENRNISFLGKAFDWENERLGISTPPIMIKMGDDVKNLFFYHGVEDQRMDGKLLKVYHLGVLFLTAIVDKDRVKLKIERLKRPVLSPTKDYETNSEWLLSAGVHAVFSCGAVPAGEKEIFIYYGAGDSNINLARLIVDDLLTEEVLEEYKEIDLKLFGIK
ncbi:MAG: hypothetical protein DRP87_14740 [Spirochaetes bacterium]|nr:MAG: hypothetical protein DRP87_14740 [Spirochaetota bacterium]